VSSDQKVSSECQVKCQVNKNKKQQEAKGNWNNGAFCFSNT